MACAKFGCCSEQLPASMRPATVNRSSTPPLGEVVLGAPLARVKNGKRASNAGPCALMRDGMLLVDPLAMPAAMTWNSGLLAGLVPPTAGCAWQPEQLFKLK